MQIKKIFLITKSPYDTHHGVAIKLAKFDACTSSSFTGRQTARTALYILGTEKYIVDLSIDCCCLCRNFSYFPEGTDHYEVFGGGDNMSSYLKYGINIKYLEVTVTCRLSLRRIILMMIILSKNKIQFVKVDKL